MTLRFTMLASGSSGNAALIEAGGQGLLLDSGLGPRQLSQRLAAADATWAAVHAVLLTHTHTDHWNDRTFAHLLRRRVPFFCHAEHHESLHVGSPAFSALKEAGLVYGFTDGEFFAPIAGVRCRAFAVPHDSGPTFGFRMEGPPDLFGHAPALAYAADLGSWDDELVGHLADVDLLALEFNHDEGLERTSGRGPHLIARVLGDRGHLSNDQACALVQAALARSSAGRLRHLVQLHLSRDCNRPELARAAACQVLNGDDVDIHTALQDTTGDTLRLGRGFRRAPRPRSRTRRVRMAPTHVQLWIPGMEWDPVGPRTLEASG